MKVLITGGKSSPSYKIIKAFEQDEVLLADYGDVPSFSAGACQLLSLGEKNEDVIAHHLLNTCLDQGVEILLPLHEFEILAVAKAAQLFSEFGIEVLLPELTEMPKYFYPREEAVKGANWALFRKGLLVYSPVPGKTLEEIGRDMALHGVFYMAENPDALTAVLFTIA